MSSEEVEAIQEELAIVRASIESLQETEKALASRLQTLLDGGTGHEDAGNYVLSDDLEVPQEKSRRLNKQLIDFTSAFQPSSSDQEKLPWSWTQALHETMKKIWGIESFRLNQEAVCNAVLSNRDVLVIMPTGGGKSLTYQLPAVLSEGTSLVISPLVALMADQNMHLKEAGVPAEMLNASTSRQDAALIMKRLLHSVVDQKPKRGSKSSKGKEKAHEDDLAPIKLCYVTPEKIAKSKTFVSTLQKMYGAGRLSRVIIDEAHCCSSMGHDFRPDYKQLSILKTLFPDTPIVALTATCPPRVMVDVLKILKLGPITNADKARPTGTVLFTSPLSRPNLHYQVLKKPATNTDLIDQIVEWIEQNHSGSQGIIYTLSQKDTTTVAQGLISQSNGRITTGIYHASLSDSHKHQVHTDWREGSIQVVCATTAFGMGIDAPHVRFVIHHTLPKSMEGYYQESGRAGRDGQVSDCLLFWKTSDLLRLSGMVASEVDGIPKLYSMTKYATELERCRSLLFAEYFNTSHSGADSVLPFSQEACGNCDNCKRDPSEIKQEDLSVEALKICDVVGYVNKMGGRVTLVQLGDLVRGIGTPMSTIISNSQARKDVDDFLADVPAGIPVPDLSEGKVLLKKEQVENLILALLLRGYLQEQFVATAYTVNSYIKLGPKSRVLLTSRDAISSGKALPSNVKVLIASSSSTTARTARTNRKTSTTGAKPRAKKAAPKKRKVADDSDSSIECSKGKRAAKVVVSDGDDNIYNDEDGESGLDEDQPILSNRIRKHPSNQGPHKKITMIEIDSGDEK
ncbi:uncharacterized protein PGTG_15039 [Puccinia graminis f. sp. tritici CRL 75-36-700-3]|uniref:ATP-dependent DNA helicase n=1 Tax=Puccinia graminis f. sp. tritici (strain CRL 75-36-700-3 / race SCCL) TaxID=418459 RepID=E3KXZ7_PUCGT|nr:uncharacterized protein PGTG_15039 [Puccinia graminis f. sp. tritici CRL 75-36-700-3]EFP89198.2 hypothetical protein PGTG_15039 [Puccinia graminis f. sp. tritici CRL 75-36-700-3]